jgi:signal transduction histidine kinase
MVIASGRRLTNLVNDILDFAKLKNHNLALSTKVLDLHHMVDVVLNLSRPLLGDKALILINQVTADLPGAQADENRVQQVLYNLIGNGIKFTKSGSITVTATQVNGWLKVSISDTGMGIGKDKFGTIFESFVQGQGSADREHSGTGLGLAVTKQLVELHGGQISVDSTVGEGSVFSFTLPTSEAQPVVIENRRDIGDSVSKSHFFADEVQALDLLFDEPPQKQIIQDRQLPKFRILLVDDEPINLLVLRNHLAGKSYQLVEASGGEEALELINKSEPFDLVLLDIMMPRVSGYKVCERLRETYSVNDLPVIFLSAKNQVADLVHSFSIGANDYLSKPIAKHELLTRVETHLKFLDINRNLESRVVERTAQLEQANIDRIAAQQQLVQSERMASLGTLAAGVAHGINNPTNFVHVSAQNMDNDLSVFKHFLIALAGEDADEEILETFRLQFKPLHSHMEIIKEGTARIKEVVHDLRVFSQLDSSHKNIVNISDCLRSSVNLAQFNYRDTAQLICELDDKPMLECYPAQLNQVFMNLIVNACDAISEKNTHAKVKVSGQVRVKCILLRDSIQITVKDNGCGMSENTLNKLFEPFYTTKQVGSGVGLGLSISYGIVKNHHGELYAQSTEGVGSVLTLTLPL